MSTSITGKAGVNLDLIFDLDVDLSEDLRAQFKIEASRWSYGTGAGAVNVIYAETITLAQPNGGGETVTLNLKNSGSLLDIFKQALTMTAINFLYIKNNSDDATLRVGGGESNDLDIFSTTSDILLIKPGANSILLNDPSAAGVDVTTNYNLKITHDGTGTATMDVDIIAMGLD